MKLPNAQHAVVEQQKIADYLLNPSHPDGGSKAKFFSGLGFQRERWTELAEALRSVAVNGTVSETETSRHGDKFVVVGELKAPNARTALVRTVWIIDRGVDAPRLVTAYPQDEGEV